MKYFIFLFVLTITSFLKISAQVAPQGFLVSSDIPFIVIGTQIWMAKDLDITIYKDGTVIPGAMTSADWIWYVNHPSVSNDAWVYPTAANASGNFTKSNPDYGKLYNWYALTNNLGVCPVNWHVPTRTEWGTLISYLGGATVAGGKLKEVGSLHWSSSNVATNASKFTAVPGGYMGAGASLGYPDRGYYWASDAYDANTGYTFFLEPTTTVITETLMGKVAGCAIRCIHD